MNAKSLPGEVPASRRALIVVATIALLLAVAAIYFNWSPIARAALIGSTCVLLWLTEIVPPWVPTILLWGAACILLWPMDDAFAPHRVVAWSIDPVLALFLGGFTFALAAHRRGLDRMLVGHALRIARGDARRLVVVAALVTAMLSMWISNVAAAALVLGALRRVYEGADNDRRLTGPLLLAVALSADVAGIATPVGSGPNGIAIAAVSEMVRIDFIRWMTFGVPLMIGLLLFVLVVVLRHVPSSLPMQVVQSEENVGFRRWHIPALIALFVATLLMWLTESFHGIAAWKVALTSTVALVGTTIVSPRDLKELDWSTLLLVAGGIAFGAMLDQVGLMERIAPVLRLEALPRVLSLFILCIAAAFLSALMSNTATATLLVPLAVTIDGSSSTAILIAVACSLGVPFVISTPPNAMAVARGLRSRELLGPGLLIMIGGCALIASTGPRVLGLLGID